MENSWKVIWIDHGRKLKKTGFNGDSPRDSGAIDYAKSIVAGGIPVSNVHVVSMRRGYGPSPQMRMKQEPGSWWCPYCLKWRVFVVSAIKTKDGITSPAMERCPVCSISTSDHYVRLHNPILAAHAATPPVRVPKPDPYMNRRPIRSRRR